MSASTYASTRLMGPDVWRKRIIRTTLYDLIGTMINEVQSSEENLIVAAVLDLLKSGRVKWARRKNPLKLAL